MLLSIGAYFYFIRVIKHKMEHTSSIENTLNNKIAEKKNIDLLTKKINEIANTRDKISRYFVDQSKIEIFVDYLENLGVQNNTKLVVDSVELAKDKSNIISASVTINGSFGNVMKVVGLIENAQYKIHINNSFVNKDISQSSGTDTKITKSISSWQANVSFNVISS